MEQSRGSLLPMINVAMFLGVFTAVMAVTSYFLVPTYRFK